jgi:plastocyanin
VPRVELLALVLVALGAACGSDGGTPPRVATTLELESGDGQAGVVTTSLAELYRVRAHDAQGASAAGVVISWAVTQGDGGITPSLDTTGATGIASARHTLGPTPGTHAAQASAPGLEGSPVVFTATAVNASPVASVDVNDNVFSPSETGVTANGTVTWTWRGTEPHNILFEDGQGNAVTQTSGTHARTFAAAGTYRYRCGVHSTSFSTGMIGQVTVP